jgi:hypothetical protein
LRSAATYSYQYLADIQCEVDERDPAQRCTLCVSRRLHCSPRTFGPEKEKKLKATEIRESLCALSIDNANVVSDTTAAVATRQEIEDGVANAAFELGKLYPAFPAERLDSIVDDMTHGPLFSDESTPLEDLFP